MSVGTRLSCNFLHIIYYVVSVIFHLDANFSIYLFIYQEPTDIPSRKKRGGCVPEVGVSEEGVCSKDHLPVKFNDPKLKNEIFVRLDKKHSYFSNYLFAVIVETFCCLPKINSCLCIIFVLVV